MFGLSYTETFKNSSMLSCLLCAAKYILMTPWRRIARGEKYGEIETGKANVRPYSLVRRKDYKKSQIGGRKRRIHFRWNEMEKM